MERLTESSLVADSRDPQSSNWISDNLLHPFLNGTGVTQIYNNFVPEKSQVAPSYVPEAKTLSTDWAIHSLASASGAVLTYAIAGKAAGMGLGAISNAAGFEGATAKALTSMTTASIVGAGLYDFAKKPNQGETRLGNAMGSMAAFGVFAAGNEMLGMSKTIAESTMLTGLGRVGVGMAGGLTNLEASHMVSKVMGSNANDVSWDDRFKAMASGGFINVAMPVVQKGVSDMVDTAMKARPFQLPAEDASAKFAADSRGQLPQLDIQNGPRGVANLSDLPDDLENKALSAARTRAPKSAADDPGDLTKLILLKQQKDPVARQAQIERVAGELADFISGSKKSLDAAVYDFRLRDPKVEATVVGALNKAAENGVDVKLAFFQPPNKSAGAEGIAKIAQIGGDASPAEEPLAHGPSPEFLAKLSPRIQVQSVAMNDAGPSIPDAFHDIVGNSSSSPISSRLIDLQSGKNGQLGSDIGLQGITGGGKLMHDKYFVRDAGSKNASVWTGSTNITDDAFGSQDNNIIQIKSKALADVYTEDFKQMWDQGSIAGTGKDLHTTINVGDSQVTVAFSPGDGAFIDSEYAKAIANAKDTVHIASMVISSPDILQALSDKIDAGVTVDGIYDGPQMRNVAGAWGRSSSDASAEKLALWLKVKGNLVEKASTPYSPDGPHDFMHNKVVAVDNQVAATGSFNMSMNATKNAENVLIINSPTIATQYTDYIKDLIQTYSRPTKGGGRVSLRR